MGRLPTWPATHLARDPLRQVPGSIESRVLDGGIDLEKYDGFGLRFRRGLTDLGSEQGLRVRRQRIGVSTITVTVSILSEGSTAGSTCRR